MGLGSKPEGAHMKTQLAKPARIKASYTDEYKRQALGVVAGQWPQCRPGGGGAGHSRSAALPLGTAPSALPPLRPPDRSASAASNNWRREIRRLRAENTKLLEQREVLKKIAGHPLRSAAQRYARIEQMSGQYKVAWLCEALLVSRSGYYSSVERRRQPGPRATREQPFARAHSA